MTAAPNAEALSRPGESAPDQHGRIGRRSGSYLAWRDLVDGIASWPLWLLLGWQDIRQRYRRSLLGPFWLTMSMAVLIATLGFLFTNLWKTDPSEYLPFLTAGLIAWAFLSGAITDGCSAFIGAEGYIKQVRLPLSAFTHRTVWRNLIIFFHNLLAYVLVLVIFRMTPGLEALWVLPGLFLLGLNATWLSLWCGLVSARFRDVPQIVNALLQPAFYITPIIWMPDLVPDRFLLVQSNPFYHLIELVRAPLLGASPALLSWQVAATTALGGWGVTFLFLRSFRSRVAYWL